MPTVDKLLTNVLKYFFTIHEILIGKTMEPTYSFYDENYKPMWNRGISRKIGESAFVQQNMPTYRLIWSPLRICPFFLLIGGLFIGMGVGIKKFSESIDEVIIPYTNCTSIEDPTRTCAEVLGNSANNFLPREGIFFVDANEIENCTCQIAFELNQPLNGTVYMYYMLTNFYQNHLDYWLSRDENQLKGNIFNEEKLTPKEPSGECKPFDKDDTGRIIYPCGVMANSMFTDVIELYYQPKNTTMYFPHISKQAYETHNKTGDEDNSMVKIPLRNTGIAWESDRNNKYNNPDFFANAKHPLWLNFTKPWGWKKSLWELDPSNMSNNGVENEDFIVWMRAAAFPWFKKLYRIVDHPYLDGLPAGNYSLHINYNYNVSSFDGDKKIILTTSAIVAGKNVFLAIAYMATGSLCICLSIFFLLVYKFCHQPINKPVKQD